MAACPKCSKPVPAGNAHCTHCNSLMPSDFVEKAPRPRVGMRFDVLGTPESWGLQKVYLARNRSNDDEVCLRLLSAAMAGEDSARERMANLLSKTQVLKAQPGIVAVLGYEVEDGQPYFIQEVFTGTSLADRLKAEKKLTAEETRRVGAAVADALAVAHGKGLAHGDLRAGSVVLGEDGGVRVTDFGVGKVVSDYAAKAMDGGARAKQAVAMYRAPELIRTDLPEPKADLFSLGCLLLECAAAARHLPDGYRASCAEPRKGYPFHDPCEGLAGLDPGIAGVARRLLAPHPADRFDDAAAAAEAIRGGAFDPAPVLKPGEKPPEIPREPEEEIAAAPPAYLPAVKKRGPSIQVIVGGIVVAGVLVWLFTKGKGEGPVQEGPTRVERPFEAASPLFRDLPGPLDSDLRGVVLPERVVSTDRRVWSRYDGAELVYVPAGDCVVGRADGPDDERPEHKPVLSAYLIDRHEVTVVQYKRFCKFTDRPMPEQPAGSTDLHPVVNVSWNDAAAYAKWAKRRLPTEAEWEKAARGARGSPFPWGDEEDVARRNGPGGEDGFEGLAPAASFHKGQSPFGLFDTAGNAWEWCEDFYSPDAYRMPGANGKDPKGPPGGVDRVVRGGSYLLGGPPVRITFRNHLRPGDRFRDIGFRCAVSVKVEAQ